MQKRVASVGSPSPPHSPSPPPPPSPPSPPQRVNPVEGRKLQGYWDESTAGRYPDDKPLVGKKRVIVHLISPSDFKDANTPWQYGIIARRYNKSPVAYAKAMLQMVASTFREWSYETLDLEFTTTGPHQPFINYTSLNCDKLQIKLGNPWDEHGYNVFSAKAALREGFNVSDYDYQVYLTPECLVGKPAGQLADPLPGEADVGGQVSWIRGPHIPRYLLQNGAQSFKAVLEAEMMFFAGITAHELGHNFGAEHANCIEDDNRGSVAWCDASATKASLTCNASKAVMREYCSPFSLMGEISYETLDRPFYIEGKLMFHWADRVAHPALVDKVEFDYSTDTYPKCSSSCTFLLQQSNAARLDPLTSVVVMLQTKHTSQAPKWYGNWVPNPALRTQRLISDSNWRGWTRRYYVLEHRRLKSNNSILLIHWTDVGGTAETHPRGVYAYGLLPLIRGPRAGPPAWVYGPTGLTDCTPLTTSWNDAGCSLGDNITLDTGNEAASMHMHVKVHPALESGLLKVTLSRVPPPPLPSPSPSPSSPSPSQPPPSPSLPSLNPPPRSAPPRSTQPMTFPIKYNHFAHLTLVGIVFLAFVTLYYRRPRRPRLAESGYSLVAQYEA